MDPFPHCLICASLAPVRSRCHVGSIAVVQEVIVREALQPLQEPPTRQVCETLSCYGLAEFELCTLGNIYHDTCGEATVLVPSLKSAGGSSVIPATLGSARCSMTSPSSRGMEMTVARDGQIIKASDAHAEAVMYDGNPLLCNSIPK
ncbi:hypothetical protein BS78_K186000 [Paspalum vaginatum]|uniref:Uncharacterized protein n=1 Tax=Paspalum vaginatum TaxID=158149 RepID=A0A9W8CF64_9POAL|nr:hypothetical protein BS78_K186000 [Paspalum vaginatum]